MPIPKLESDMAQPVCAYLESMGYDVRSELLDTDIVGINKADIASAQHALDVFKKTKKWNRVALRAVGVELKRHFNVDVIAQAARALRRFGSAVIVVPEPKTNKNKINTKAVEKAEEICGALNIGLLFYCADGNIRVVREMQVTPSATFYNKSTVREFLGRSKDMNIGGTTGVKRMTSYAEATHKIVSFLAHAGVAHVRSITEATKEASAANILRKNYKKLFDFVEKDGKRNGYYCLTPAGRAAASAMNATLHTMNVSTNWPDYEVHEVWRLAFEKKVGKSENKVLTMAA